MRTTAPTRFLVGVLALWSGARIAMVQPWAVLAPVTIPIARLAALVGSGGPVRAGTLAGNASLPQANMPPLPSQAPHSSAKPVLLAAASSNVMRLDPPAAAKIAAASTGHTALALAQPAAPPPAVGPKLTPIAPPPPTAHPSRWSGYAYTFVRQGSAAAALSPDGQLGGSQAAARLAYRIDDAGHFAVAARAALPLQDTHGAELAFGVDLHPLPALPIRFSLERRVALGRDARNAWSAYAAGGFFKGLGHGFEADGYAQGGVVGFQSHDLFADGAVRVGHRWPLGDARAVVLGGAVWAAAQPGVSRVDVGPRAALSGRLDKLPVTLALEGRFRVAGRAAPGSGVALTLASDF